MSMKEVETRSIMTTCNSHCGGACGLKVYVKEGVIVRIETDDGEEPQARACLRCRAYRQRVYHPDRLLYPLERVGQRGEGKFRRVSWDEALDKVASEIKRVRDTYGPASILCKTSGGDIVLLHRGTLSLSRLLSLSGGYSEVWSTFSYEAAIFAEIATYGKLVPPSSRDDLLNSRLILMWGWNPTSTIQDTGTTQYLAQAKEKGNKVISVDPKFTDTTAIFADQWIPIRPGTDTAMLMAMAYVIITSDLHDQGFLDKYAAGFDKFKAYILGKEDGIPKTPAWAEAITGVASQTIVDLAITYATIKPAAFIAGIGPGRSASGEHYHRTAMILSAITGNIGVRGGSAAQRSHVGGLPPYPFLTIGPGPETPANPVELEKPRTNDRLPLRWILPLGKGSIHASEIADAILKGRSGGYPADYKLLYLASTSYPNQYLNVNKHIKALKSESLEFVVMHEQFMTPGAKFADIILPVSTFLERNDLTMGHATGFYGYMNKVIEPLGESKSSFEICEELSKKLGIHDYNSKTEDDWLQGMVKGVPAICDYDDFKRKGLHKIHRDEPYVALEMEIKDPENNPLPTPSGKIEIFSQLIADLKNPQIPPIPKHVDGWEGLNDPLARKYPLQLITTHFKQRAHSQFDNIPWLRELEPQSIMISTADAKARGIKNGELVKVFNDRGEMIIPAKVTERIMPGVVDVPQGAWYKPDDQGVDRGGCANVLTMDRSSPGGAFATNTALVQVQKI